MSSNGVAGGSAPLKKALRELESMERRLNFIIEKCLTPEELEKRRKDRFGSEKKRLIELLGAVKQDLITRDAIAKEGKNADSIQLNARCRRDLADAASILSTLERDVQSTEKKLGDTKDPKKKKLLAQKRAGLENVREMYQICKDLFDAASGEPHDNSRNELMQGIEMTPSSTSSSTFSKGGKGIQLDPEKFTAVSAAPSQYEDQWQALLEREEEVETQYLEAIEDNLNILHEISLAMGDEIDKQDVLLTQIETQTDKAQVKTDALTKKATQVQEVSQQSNRCLYLIVIVVILIVVGFVLIKFVF